MAFPTSCNHPGCTSMHGMAPQAGIHSTRVPVAGEVSQPSPIAPGPPLPTNTHALQSMIYTLQAQLQATVNVNTHLAASVTHLGQAFEFAFTPTTPTPIATTAPTATEATATPAPAPAPDPDPVPCLHPDHPCTIASGRGAASPEIFKQMIKTNWHGRLGRVHMVDVDALSPTALAELDSLLRRRMRPIFPRGGARSWPQPDPFFASLASLGLRLEDRGGYADVPDTPDSKLHDAPFTRRGEDLAAWYLTSGDYGTYWLGVAMETMVELARYRGLFDEEGFLM